jgi:hypothetical protein
MRVTVFASTRTPPFAEAAMLEQEISSRSFTRDQKHADTCMPDALRYVE